MTPFFSANLLLRGSMSRTAIALIGLACSACQFVPQAPKVDLVEAAPARPLPQVSAALAAAPRPATGSLFQTASYRPSFEDRRARLVGDTVTITLTVLNTGRGPALNVVIPRAFTESGFIIVRTTPVDGSYNDATKQWTIPRIDAGGRARLLLTAIVVPPAAPQPNAP